MDWKTFFKPTIAKIIIFLLLMGGLNYLIISSTYILDARILVGLPLGFWPIGSFMMWPNAPTPPTVEFSWINFIIDIVFWYLVSCGVVALYHTIRKK
jgi:hypothetical protein